MYFIYVYYADPIPIRSTSSQFSHSRIHLIKTQETHELLLNMSFNKLTLRAINETNKSIVET